jgi:hypothetical protein
MDGVPARPLRRVCTYGRQRERRGGGMGGAMRIASKCEGSLRTP